MGFYIVNIKDQLNCKKTDLKEKKPVILRKKKLLKRIIGQERWKNEKN